MLSFMHVKGLGLDSYGFSTPPFDLHSTSWPHDEDFNYKKGLNQYCAGIKITYKYSPIIDLGIYSLTQCE
jgi:hypothetical protein